jgi:hypothetical protein
MVERHPPFTRQLEPDNMLSLQPLTASNPPSHPTGMILSAHYQHNAAAFIQLGTR